ncbi:unnamed protein product [Pleuronectes platessa]|uniref:Uncharacterized protein n=1 Tax=Pleuronectes platessa TaxID=8262 RepID=A0A9N7UT36_PLEPL|nr:unnamed protein product [Pleuronectes platessa]
MRLQILQEVVKTERDYVLIENRMQSTFSLRRKDIVEGNPQVGDFLERWPVLRVQMQVQGFIRFNERTSKNQDSSQLDGEPTSDPSKEIGLPRSSLHSVEQVDIAISAF